MCGTTDSSFLLAELVHKEAYLFVAFLFQFNLESIYNLAVHILLIHSINDPSWEKVDPDNFFVCKTTTVYRFTQCQDTTSVRIDCTFMFACLTLFMMPTRLL